MSSFRLCEPSGDIAYGWFALDEPTGAEVERRRRLADNRRQRVCRRHERGMVAPMGAVLLIILAIVVAVVLGIAVVGLALKLLWWALIGLVIGALARLVLPGAQSIGWLWTILAGVGGALLGGVIADALDVGSILQFLIAIGVAAALIAVLGGSRRTAI